MKFFIDTADVKEIREANELGLVDGVTTNPSLIAKSGRRFEEVIKEITEIVDGPISAEVISLEHDGMIAEASELVKIHPNIVIKLPMTPEGLKATKTLTARGIKTNVTLIFTPMQALLAAKAGATLRVIIAMGKFQGVMAAQTPMGCFSTSKRLSPVGAGMVSP